MENNKIILEIYNCTQCPYCYRMDINSADIHEKPEALYCMQVPNYKNNQGYYKHFVTDRCITIDDYNVEKYANIPDWCPLLKKRGN